MNKSEILQAFNFRHACKVFDSKKVPDEDINFILEAGLLSPSSFGMEHWKFLVIENQEIKNLLKPFCWNQNQIDSCSHLVALIAKIDNIKPKSSYRKEMLSRKGLSRELLEAYLKKYDDYVGAMSESEIVFWSEKQCYIAGANMASAAAMIGIDSCFIEGFEKHKVSELLNLKSDVSLAYFLCFGYRKNEQPRKYRLKSEEIIEFLK